MDSTTTAIIIAIIGSSGVWGVVNAIVGHVMKRLDEKRGRIAPEEFEAHGRALRGLLYGELAHRCTAYLAQGHISPSELTDIRTYYFEPYKSLGGDGTIDHLMAKIEALDIKED